MPRLAERVTAMGLVINWLYMAPDFVRLQRAMSGWFVIKVAVFCHRNVSKRYAQNIYIDKLDSTYTHATVDSINKEPTPAIGTSSRSCGIEMSQSDVASGIGHAEDEETPDCREHNDRFGYEEGAQLVRAQKGKRQMDTPEEEERKHASAGDTN